MTTPENLQTPTTRVCLLDFTYEDLRRILDDETLSAGLTEFNESSALTRIDELMNLQEAPIVGFLLNRAAAEKLRLEWTVEIPRELADTINEFIDPLELL